MNIPKTGLTARIREYISQVGRTFTVDDICAALSIPPGAEREKVNRYLGDFMDRGEIERLPVKQNARQNTPGQKLEKAKYRYNQGWSRALKGTKKARALKAMYVNSSFAASDIARLAELGPVSNFVNKIVRGLLKRGVLQVIGRRRCAHGAGAERIFRIVDRDKFRIEEMR